MAKTRDYLDYLDEKIEISPANSQEEYQAAQTIAEVMRDHGLETSIEEFDAYSVSGAIPAILMLVMFVTLLVAGLTEGMLHIVVLLISIVSVGILLLSHFLFDVFESFGPTQRSQNVVGLHRAEGDKVTKGSRPIVIVAHYDSPRESILRRGPLARYEAAIRRGCIPCACAVAVSLLIQLMGFLPDIIRIAMWVVGLVASVPTLLLAITTIIDRHGSCSLGANDNKSSVAAMLSILNKVRPGEDRVSSADLARSSHRRDGDAPVESSTRRVEVVEEVKGVRHGEQVMNALGILPASCQLVYEEPKVRIVEEELDSEQEEIDDEAVGATEESPAKSDVPDVDTDDEYDEWDDDDEWGYEDDEDLEDDEDRDEDDDEGEASDKDEGKDEVDEDDESEDANEEEIESDDETESDEEAKPDEEVESDDEAKPGEEDQEEEETDKDSDEDEGYDDEDDEYEEDDEAYDEDDYDDDYDDEDYDDENDEEYDDEDEENEDGEEPERKGFFARIIDWIAEKIRAFIAIFTSRKDEDEDFEIERGEDRTVDEDDEYDEDDYEDDEYEDDEYEDVYEEDTDEYEERDEGDEGESDAEAAREEDDDELKAPVLTYRPQRRNTYDDELPSWDDGEEDTDTPAPQLKVVEDQDYDGDGDNVEEDDRAEEDDRVTDDGTYREDEEVTYGDPRDFEYDDEEERENDSRGFYEEEEEDTYEGGVSEDELNEGPEEADASRRAMPVQQAPLEDAEQAYANAEPTMVGLSIADRLKGLFSKKDEKDERVYTREEEYSDARDDSQVDADDYTGEYSYEADDQSYFEGSVEDDRDRNEDTAEDDDSRYDSRYGSRYESRYDSRYDSRYETDERDNPYVNNDARAVEENPYDAADAYEDDDEYDEEDYKDEYKGQYRGVYTSDRHEEASVGEVDSHEDAEPSKEEEVLVQRPEDPNRLHFDREEDDDIVPRDTTGLDTISDSYDLYSDEHVQVDPTYEKPEPIDDPNWGVSSYQPARPSINIARRAALFDLPDPSSASVDPLADDDYEDEYEDEKETRRPDDSKEVDSGTQQNTDPTNVDQSTWDDEGNGGNGSGWKGGAAVRSDLRDANMDGAIVIDADDLQDAILEMGDDFLVAHDIWFVATGASRVGHAGIKAFLKEHQRDIRGAFLVNLECVGAGDLTVLTREGLHAPRRADRRLIRLLTGVAKDLHIDLDTTSYDFDETESASAMRSRIRSITITGLDENGMQAYSGSDDDVPENVDPKQVSSVVRLVTEMIRRS